MKLYSPITWKGGKSKQFEKIRKLLPKEKIITFIEPFCGGSSVSLNIANENLAKKIILNDLNFELINFWKNLNFMNNEKLEQIMFPNVKNIKTLEAKIKSLNFNKNELFFIHNNLNFNGLKWGTFTLERLKKNFNENKFKRLKIAQNLIQNNDFRIYNFDYKILIKKFGEDKNCVWFLDPPYYFNNKRVYEHYKFDFKEFKNEVLKIKGKWIFSIEDNQEIRKLFKEFNIFEEEWKYTSSNNKKCKIGKELFITNFIN